MTPSGYQMKAILQAQRQLGRDLVSRDFPLPIGQPVRLGREARLSPKHPQYNPDYGSDLVFREDDHISNFHALLTWDGRELRVQRWKSAKNRILMVDPDDPSIKRPQDDFAIAVNEQFQIGSTVFTVLADEVPSERTRSGQELDELKYVDPAPRVEALSTLPDLIRSSPKDEDLEKELLRVILRGVPRSEVAAVVALTPSRNAGDDAVMKVRGVMWRSPNPKSFQPSRRLVKRAIEGNENVRYAWPTGGGGNEYATIAPGADWALCVRFHGPANEGLYVAGRAGGSVFDPDSQGDARLDGDMKFAKLAADIYAGLRALRTLQQREAFLFQMLSPEVRKACEGKSFEEVTAPHELPVTVLFCDLRGSVRAIEKGASDLGKMWKTVSQALDVMTAAIVESNGVIGDFQGDAAMGFWGWPLPQADQIERAAKAAITIRQRFAGFARDPSHPLAGFVCGVGLAHGPAIAGKLGSMDQMKIGVFGPAVNRAARMESATKRFKVPVLADEAVTLALLNSPSLCRVRKVARIVPEGMEKPVLVGEILPPDVAGSGTISEVNRKLYEAALDRFEAGDWATFRRVTADLTDDGPVEFMTKFIDTNATPDGRPPEGWSGGIPVLK